MKSRMFTAAVFTSMVVMLAGCGGPKKTCKKSAKSYFSMLSSQDWKGIYKILTEEHRKQIGSPANLKNFMEFELEYFGSKKFKLKQLEAYPGRDSCNVSIVYDYNVKIRGQEEVTHANTAETLIFKKSPKDGLWYMEIPGASNIAGY